VYRHFRHTLTIPASSTFQRLLFPDLFVAASVSASVTAYNTFYTPLQLSLVPFTLCSLAVGLLVKTGKI